MLVAENLEVLDILTALSSDEGKTKKSGRPSRANMIVNSPYKNGAIDMARRYLRLFFEDKIDEEGGGYPEAYFLSPRNVFTVLNTTIADGISMFYDMLDDTNQSDEEAALYRQPDIQLLVSLIHRAESLRIPQPLTPGIFLVYANLFGRSEVIRSEAVQNQEDWDVLEDGEVFEEDDD